MAATSESWQDQFRRQKAGYERLQEEAEFALRSRLEARKITLHSMTARVKALSSLEDKALRKDYGSPLEQTPDIVGLRVVVLFLSDISAVADIVHDLFDVVDTSEKVEGSADPSTFGYMSQHFEVRIPATLTGPRYEGLPSIRFEVQVRTLLMDAWANVSHFLAYKGESSIPPELRRDFFALSGLFYVADKHFELFFDRAEVVRDEAAEQLATGTDTIALNLDSLAAFLLTRFPDRTHSTRPGVAELADDLLRFGYDTIDAVEKMLAETADEFAVEERDEPPNGEVGQRFQDVGVVRISLAKANPGFRSYQLNDAELVDDDETPTTGSL